MLKRKTGNPSCIVGHMSLFTDDDVFAIFTYNRKLTQHKRLLARELVTVRQKQFIYQKKIREEINKLEDEDRDEGTSALSAFPLSSIPQDLDSSSEAETSNDNYSTNDPSTKKKAAPEAAAPFSLEGLVKLAHPRIERLGFIAR